MAYLNLASVRLYTESEGPGKRMAIWCQGCHKRCRNCCNVEMQELRKNMIVDTKDIIELIKKSVSDNSIEGVSFIGGEPMLQAEGFAQVAKWCQENGLSVLVFTGYLYSEIKEMNNQHINKLLENTDLLVDGPYVDEMYDDERDWVGSKNQKVIFLSDRYPKDVEFISNKHSMEILVSEKNILVNGWPF